MENLALYLVISLHIITVLIIYLSSRMSYKKDILVIRNEVVKESRKEVMALKIKAVERLTLFLERISPESIILREQGATKNNFSLQATLLASIRQEYEHNQVMQVYVSTETWERVKLAKEEVVRMVNMCSAEVNPANPSLELARIIIERFSFAGASHIDRALLSLRNEVDSMLN